MEQMKIFFFFFILTLSSAAEDRTSDLTGVQGGSVTLPGPVLENGFFTFKDKIIASVQDRKCKIWEKIYEDRLFWNNKTGLFTIRGLQKDDSGIYKTESRDGEGIITYHQLTVYEPVSAPEVSRLNLSTETCTLLCEVQSAEETSLLWFREEEVLNQSSWTLSLPLTVHRPDFSSSFRCVAENPGDTKTLHVNTSSLCSLHRLTNCNSQTPGCYGGANSGSWFFLRPVLLFTAAAAAVSIITMCVKRRRERKRERERERETEGADLN